MRYTAYHWLQTHMNCSAGKKLQHAVMSQIRARGTGLHNYFIEDLIEDIHNGTVKSWQGIGQTTVDKLIIKLQSNGYEPIPPYHNACYDNGVKSFKSFFSFFRG